MKITNRIFNHDDLLGITTDNHHPKIHADSHKSGGDDVIIIGSSPIDSHASEHLSGGADSLPWGAGGGLNVDLLDGYHAADLLRLPNNVSHDGNSSTTNTGYVTYCTFTISGIFDKIYVMVTAYGSDSNTETYIQVVDDDGIVVLDTNVWGTTPSNRSTTYTYTQLKFNATYTVKYKSNDSTNTAHVTHAEIQFLE